MAMGDPYVLDLGRRAESGCEKCGTVSLFCASLIPQDWMQSKDHIPATNCLCGANYYSWATKKTYECRRKTNRKNSEASE